MTQFLTEPSTFVTLEPMKTHLNAQTVKALLAFNVMMRTAEVSHRAELATARAERDPVQTAKEDGMFRTTWDRNAD